jgi:hypothetical protein
MLQHLPALRVAPGFPAARQFPDLALVLEGQRLWERSLQPWLQKGHVSDVAPDELHVDPVVRPRVAAHAGSVGEYKSKVIHTA